MFAVMGDDHLDKALDVACGTGLSTVALANHARVPVGVDSVQAMVQSALRASNTFYALAAAEQLPFHAKMFDLLTVSSGVHWFDQPTFFAEAARVLVPSGWIGIYDHFFVGSADEPAIDEWLKHDYAERYPAPPRAAMADRPLHTPKEFAEVEAIEYNDPIAFTHDELVAYLLSHSNTIVAATAGRETQQQTEEWLRIETEQWFGDPDRRTFLFRGAARCLVLGLSEVETAFDLARLRRDEFDPDRTARKEQLVSRSGSVDGRVSDLAHLPLRPYGLAVTK
jgi:SAM-dependent methyltransferase